MEWNLGQLAALAAVASEGTFDGAARRLHVSPSAVSQRVKALEQMVGRVLVVRTHPARMTASGEEVLRLARQVEVLTDDAGRALGQAPSAPPSVPIVVNADSLDTWALPALAPVADRVRVDIVREDQDHSARLLRDGTAMAAVTSLRTPVQGCTVTPLGRMRYRAMATPAYAERWFPDGVTVDALAVAPMVVFDRKDDLQDRYLRRRSQRAWSPPRHYVPATAAFTRAVRLSFGWGLLMELDVGVVGAADGLVELDPQRPVDVPLYWQQWKLRSPALDALASAVADGARAALRPPTRRR
ncbi:transcriptional regulator, LysR family [Beutenbergia cavernae DSM 12333]|uniref:Transcriptional regulator, LysR family n=1 Tax=Beutenbergia cavernae (strain ATCC BAA-8 / DSM 12333 / CCUG 43141 / JCM 11478 / NBRC 16432 / NCIMB 13614 / HKI 0122) TaxID=471853 RepID=C5C3Z3_BEUC1|nr:LysR family transcriptional regulator ArgP [Beutenbergia cavernae]ACQ79906.1 transcriptional regulator, LysR family [Beutenbergia cavernae DSM 12333]